uniref:epidermal growth factor receptor kinase substrate 8-like protein 3b isoform X3 n=1 Tax=Scatophagus argus TaxID=75038 RepID=UPI001ED81BF1|nr:epidermal growth factor receptor kinase substrate 8-like protein 3b isoform X3 [Scatophagus argus]
MFGHNGPFSYSPRGFSQDDFPQHKRPFQQDEFKGSSFQRNDMFRPSGKSIYMQRKEYSETLNKQSDNFHVRVEHLFTCELDGQELKTVDDCVAKLKRLDTKGRLWPQEMIMEVQGGYLLLSDIETKAELESLPLSYIQKTKAVLDSCAYDSLLTVTIQERNRRFPQVYMFQCEEMGAELIKTDLDKVVQNGDNVEPRREQPDIRINLENIIGLHTLGSFRQNGPSPVQRERTPPPPDHPPPQFREPEYIVPLRVNTPQEKMMFSPDYDEFQSSPDLPVSPEQMQAERNSDIFNHVVNDLEVFMSKLSAVKTASLQEDRAQSTKKNLFKKKKKSPKNAAPAVRLPPAEEYISCLQKIKYGFNLLGQLDGILVNPTAPEFVHIFFSILAFIVPQYPAELPPTVVSPLLTVTALRLLSQALDQEEDQLWRALGDSWNIPRTRWPEDVPPYIPDFYDGWQPPAPSSMSSPPPYRNSPISRSNSQRFTPDEGHPEPISSGPWGSPPPANLGEPPLYMRVIYDFMARNNQELSIMKGDVVQVIQKSKQWWLVRNNRDEQGNVPQNVLEPMRSTGPMDDQMRDTHGPVTLDMMSSSAEVKAWLQHKGFSKITVSTLGVLTGKLLLGMTKDEIRTVCPEEGGKVFFQLQAIKSAIALASEPSGLYNGRY